MSIFYKLQPDRGVRWNSRTKQKKKKKRKRRSVTPGAAYKSVRGRAGSAGRQTTAVVRPRPRSTPTSSVRRRPATVVVVVVAIVAAAATTAAVHPAHRRTATTLPAPVVRGRLLQCSLLTIRTSLVKRSSDSARQSCVPGLGRTITVSNKI